MALPRKKPEEPDHAPLASVLARAAEELRVVAGRLAHLDAIVGRVALDSFAPHSPEFFDLQQIDRTMQEAAGLAQFLENLAGRLPAHWAVDAESLGAAIKLQHLVDAITRPGKAARDGGEGDYESFV